MGRRYYVKVECDSDTPDPVASLLVVIRGIAPYMVDNVETEYGIVNRDGSYAVVDMRREP